MVEILKDLERLRREHHICEYDCWYSCPLADDECGGWDVQACDCGADEHNAILDEIIERVRALQTGHTTVVVELDATDAIRQIDRHFLRILDNTFRKINKNYRRMWE